MKVYSVKRGTMPADVVTRPADRVLRVGKHAQVKISGHVPAIGAKNGARQHGGLPPMMPTPFRAYQRIEVYGLQCSPKTITGSTKGDPVWSGDVPKGWKHK